MDGIKIFFCGAGGDNRGVGGCQCRGGIAFNDGHGENGEDAGVAVGDPIFLYILFAVSKADVFLAQQSYGSFDFGEVAGQGCRYGWGGDGEISDIVTQFHVGIDPEDPVGLYVVPVIAELVRYIEYNEQAGGQAEGESQDIEKGKTFILQQATEGCFYIIFKHGQVLIQYNKKSHPFRWLLLLYEVRLLLTRILSSCFVVDTGLAAITCRATYTVHSTTAPY